MHLAVRGVAINDCLTIEKKNYENFYYTHREKRWL